MKKKLLSILLALCILAVLLPSASAEEAPAAVQIVLGNEQITVGGQPIGQDTAAAVYLEKRNEQHPDVSEELKDVINSVVVITAAGTYSFSGELTDGQIAVRAGQEDSVRIILNGVSITNRTAPAIQVYTAKQTYDEGKYFVTIELAAGSENYLNGSHTAKKDPLEADAGSKHDAAISSNVSFGFEGTGSVEIEGDCEGIEVKYGHLTVNGGKFHITSADDPVNGSEDGVAVVTINDGYFACSVDPLKGFEGDGIDSNGYIKINGGTLITRAHPTSMDGGIDSDAGSFINGGTVVAAGNMYDAIDEGSTRLYMMLQFVDRTDALIVVTDAQDKPIFAYDFPYSYTYIVFSLPALTEGTYHVYIGGEIQGDEEDGLYTNIVSYTGGEQMRHGGDTASGTETGAMPGMPGQMPEGFTPPEGMTPPEDFTLPEDFTPPEDGQMPDMGGMMAGPGGRGMADSSESASYDFVLSLESRTFTNVTSASLEEGLAAFSDVEQDAWYYDGVTAAVSLGLIDGMSDGTFRPDGSLTYAQTLKLAACVNQMFNTAEVTLENGSDVWYSTYVDYCLENGIIAEAPANPNETITRAEFAAVFAKAIPEKGLEEINDIADNAIPDVAMSDPAADAVYLLYRTGILTGSDDLGTFNPTSNIRRSEVAAIVVRMLRTSERQEFELGTTSES